MLVLRQLAPDSQKSSTIEKISLAQAAAVSSLANAVGQVDVVYVNSTPMVVNPNGQSGMSTAWADGQARQTTKARSSSLPRGWETMSLRRFTS